MTAQEAAQHKQTRFYRILALIFAAGGSVALLGMSLDDIGKAVAGLAGGGAMLTSVLGAVADMFAKKTSKGVADDAVERIFLRFGKMESMMEDIAAQGKATETTRATDHAENKGQVEGLRQDVEAIKMDVQSLKGTSLRHDAELDVLKRLLPEGLQQKAE